MQYETMTPASLNDRNPDDYRPTVGIMLVNMHGDAFVGKRIDEPGALSDGGDCWQMPQRGIKDGDEPKAAALQELNEEIGLGSQDVHIVLQHDEELYCDLPASLQEKLSNGRYKGQRQTWFLATLLGSDHVININANDQSGFCEWKWVAAAELEHLAVPFKRSVYRAVTTAFGYFIGMIEEH